MKTSNVVLLSILGIVVIVALSFGFGWTGVFYTKTVGTAQESANRYKFKHSQSYTDAKYQELVKFHHEWVLATDADKKPIESLIRQDFADFNANDVPNAELYQFLKHCIEQ